MANEIELVNGVTKIELQGSGNYKYLFPLAQIIAYPNADVNKGYYNWVYLEDVLNSPRIEFGYITDKLGASNIVEYVDILAQNKMFFEPCCSELVAAQMKGCMNVTDSVVTIIALLNTYTNIANATVLLNASNTDSPANFRVRNTSGKVLTSNLVGFFTALATISNIISIGVYTYENGGANETLVSEFRGVSSTIATLTAASKIYIDTDVTLQPNGYVDLKIKNQTTAANVTVTPDSFLRLK